MIRRLSVVTYVLGSTLLGSAVFAQSPPGSAPRPIPYPVAPPAEFQTAITKGTRTTTGKPGGRYWQQWATYKLTAKVDVERHVLEGTAKIVYYNRSPHTLSQVAFHLYK